MIVLRALWGNRKTRLAVLAGLAAAGGAFWWLQDTAPFPYAQRRLLDIPLPWLTPRRLAAALQPQPGERVLELGPGTGLQSLHIAPQLGDDGRLDIVDIQQEMLDHVAKRAADEGVSNIVPTCADATALPFDAAGFDAAYLVTVLGEIPDSEAVIAELSRVLRPGGRLVVGEFLDRHFVPFGRLAAMADRYGLRPEYRAGPPLAYYAVFRRS